MIEQIKKILEENNFILESNKSIDAIVFFKHKDEDNIDKYRRETYKHTKTKNFYCDLKDNKCRFCFGFVIKDTNSGINSNTGWLEIKSIENFISIMQCVVNICNNFGKCLGEEPKDNANDDKWEEYCKKYMLDFYKDFGQCFDIENPEEEYRKWKSLSPEELKLVREDIKKNFMAHGLYPTNPEQE